MEKILRYTEKDFQDFTMSQWLQTKETTLQPIAIKWCNEIKNCGIDVQQIFHDDCPTACVDNAPFAYVNIFKAHVNVGFFYGAFLPDTHKLLQGNGKRMRHITIKPGLDYNEPELQHFIKAAYADIKLRVYDK